MKKKLVFVGVALLLLFVTSFWMSSKTQNGNLMRGRKTNDSSVYKDDAEKEIDGSSFFGGTDYSKKDESDTDENDQEENNADEDYQMTADDETAIEDSDINDSVEEISEEYEPEELSADGDIFVDSYSEAIPLELVFNLNQYNEGSSVILPDVKGKVRTSMPSIGNINTLVITCDFEGDRYSNGFSEEVKKWFNGDENTDSSTYPYESLSAYYARSSFGKLHLTSDFYEYHSSHSRDYYYDSNRTYENTADYDPINEIVKTYYDYLKNQCDGTEDEKEEYANDYLKRFDSNNDKQLDGVYIVFSGKTSEWGGNWWSSVGYWNRYKLGSYSFGSSCKLMSEQVYSYGDYWDVKTIIHETGHMLGLDDYYDKTEWGLSHGSVSMKTFEMMQNNTGDMNGFSKMLLGWLDPEKVVVLKGKEIDEQNISIKSFANNGDVVIAVPEWEDENGLYDEFYMFEYYKSEGNDTFSPLANKNGLRIYHVYAKLDDTKSKFIADNTKFVDGSIPLIQGVDKDELSHYDEGGSWGVNGVIGSINANPTKYNCFYYQGDSFTPFTIPSTSLYGNNTNRNEVRAFSGLNINDVVISADKADFTIKYIDEEQRELEYTVVSSSASSYSDSKMVHIRLNMEAWFSTGESEQNISLFNEAGAKAGNLSIQAGTVNKLCMNAACSDFIITGLDGLDNAKYSIVIPENTFVSSCGVGNKEWKIDYDNRGNVEVVDKDKIVLNKSHEFGAFIDGTGSGGILDINITDASIEYNYYVVENCLINNPENPTKLNVKGPEGVKYGGVQQIEYNETEDVYYISTFYSDHNSKGSYGDVIDLIKLKRSTLEVISERIVQSDEKYKSGIVRDKYAVYDGTKIHLYDFENDANDTEIETWCIFNYSYSYPCTVSITMFDNKYYYISGYLFDDEGKVIDLDSAISPSAENIDGKLYCFGSKSDKNNQTINILKKYDEKYKALDEYKIPNTGTRIGKMGEKYVCYSLRTVGAGSFSSNLMYLDSNFNTKTTVNGFNATAVGYSADCFYYIGIGKYDSNTMDVVVRKIDFSNIQESENANIIDFPSSLNATDNELTISSHLSKADFEKLFEDYNYLITYSGNESEYITADNVISISNNSESVTKYYYVSESNEFTHTEEEIPEVPPGCETTGMSAGKKCSVCGEILVVPQVEGPTGHTYSMVDETPAKCTEDGYKKGRVCKNCGEVYDGRETIPALGHDWDEGEVTTPATCEADGVKTFTCQRTGCNETKTEKVQATGHSYGSLIAKTEASCTDDGMEAHYECSSCHKLFVKDDDNKYIEKTEAQLKIEASGHTFDQTDTAAKYLKSAADCTHPAVYYKSCHCGEKGTETFESGKALGHDWDEGEVTTPATCEADGVKTFTCQRTGCSETKTEEVQATGHSYGSLIAKTEASCTEDGMEAHYECSSCHKLFVKDDDNKYIEKTAEELKIAASGHTFDQTDTAAKYLKSAADCTHPAVYYKCCHCGEKGTETFESGKALGHDWDEGEVTTPATCEADGVKTFTCQITGCNETKTEKVQATGHSYGSLIAKTDASCTEDGMEAHYECSSCHKLFVKDDDNKYIEKTEAQLKIEASGHTFDQTDTAAKYLKSAADCTHPAVYYKSCHCGEKGTETFESGKALGHDWDEGEVTTPATCEADGVKTFTCQRTGCNETKTEKVQATGHSYGSLIAKTEASCTEDGMEAHYECSSCHKLFVKDDDNKYIEKTAEELKIAASGHTFDQTDTAAKYLKSAADCTHPAVYYKSCHCGEKGTETFESGKALGHDWDEGEVTTPATCEADGVKTFTCQRTGCNETKTEKVQATGHSYGSLIAKTDASCTEDGMEAHYECSSCHKLFVKDDDNKYIEKTEAQLKIEASGHTFDQTDTAAKYLKSAADCTHPAVYYKSCHCGEKGTETFESGKALGHDWDEGEVTTPATCEADGVKTFTCQRTGCNETKTEIVQATGHSYGSLIAKTDASCTEDGMEAHYECSSCHKLFIKDDDNKYIEKTEAQLKIEASGHTFDQTDTAAKYLKSAADCTHPAVYYKSCYCGEKGTETFESGKALGHDEVTIEAKVPTCTEAGHTAGKKCTRCNTIIEETVEVPALGHDWDDGTVTKAATCKEVGVMTYHCSRCTETYTESIDKLDHTPETVPGVEASCTVDGLSEGSRCSKCGEVLAVQKVTTKALGHNWKETVIEAATCQKAGKKLCKCTRCGEEKEETIAKRAHSIVIDTAVEATTTSTGLTVGTHCSVCGEVIVKQEIVPMKTDNSDSKNVPNENNNPDDSNTDPNNEDNANTIPKNVTDQDEQNRNNEVSNPAPEPQTPAYSNEWVNGKWYDAQGNQTYEGTLVWKKDSVGWWIEDSSGWYPVKCWQKIDGYWYYFDTSGYMVSSAWQDGCWLGSDGAWTYEPTGSWKGGGSSWWFEDTSGWYPYSQWLKINGSWYYFDASGYMVTSKYIDGYWLGADGVCQ